VAALVAALPPTWVAAARASTLVDSPAARLAVERSLMGRLGWWDARGRPVLALQLTVKQATWQMQAPQRLERARRFEEYRAVALRGGAGHLLGLDAAAVPSMLASMWRLPWENVRKEPLWRLVLDALPTASRMGQRPENPTAWVCQCGARAPDREHHFWSCPVAQAVRAEMQRCVPGAELCRYHLWLAVPPCPSVRKVIWRVVVLAAIGAMRRAWGSLTAWRLEAVRGEPSLAAALPAGEQLGRAGRVAVAAFWDLLQDAVGGCSWPPGGGAGGIGPQHPFICCSVAEDWALNMPEGGVGV
jgi:hypothetical protein